MSRRQRWQPVSGFGSRVYEPRERLLLGALDLPGLLAPARLRRAIEAPPVDPARLRRVLVLRLDRIGDVLMSLPALVDLRAALPGAHITLAVGAWSEPLARRAPVDDVCVLSAPWVSRRREGGESLWTLVRKVRSLARRGVDLALDLQGDVRATLLMALSGARARVGYSNTGGGWLLTHAVALDESVSWIEQNRRAVTRACGQVGGGTARFPPLVDAAAGAEAREILADAGVVQRPWIGIHPSGGRSIKQWDVSRWRAAAEGLLALHGGSVVVTGSAADRELAATLVGQLGGRAVDLAGRLRLEQSLAILAELDLFLSSDTGPMHLACAVGTPSVSVFGPSDSVRFFSGGNDPRHVALAAELWCRPCNLIRRPPAECRGGMPECLGLVSVEQMVAAGTRVLSLARPSSPGGR